MTDNTPLPPETHNSEQDDEPAQAQTVAAAAKSPSGIGTAASEHGSPQGLSGIDTPDLVDKMKQMEGNGVIDMGAYRGERNDDDDDDKYGAQAREDDGPRGAA